MKSVPSRATPFAIIRTKEGVPYIVDVLTAADISGVCPTIFAEVLAAKHPALQVGIAKLTTAQAVLVGEFLVDGIYPEASAILTALDAIDFIKSIGLVPTVEVEVLQ